MAYKNFSARTDNWTNEHESGAHLNKYEVLIDAYMQRLKVQKD